MRKVYQQYFVGLYFLVLKLENSDREEVNGYFAYSTLLVMNVAKFACYYGASLLFGFSPIIERVGLVVVGAVFLIFFDWFYFFREDKYIFLIEKYKDKKNILLLYSSIVNVLILMLLFGMMIYEISNV